MERLYSVVEVTCRKSRCGREGGEDYSLVVGDEADQKACV